MVGRHDDDVSDLRAAHPFRRSHGGTAVTKSTDPATTEGSRRIDAAVIPGRRLEITVRAGRVELGHSTADQLRVRWTVPDRPLLGPSVPSFHFGPGGLAIRCPRARLRIDLPAGMSVQVRQRRGQITSWGAEGDLDLAVRRGSVACRELRSQVARIRAPGVNLHFAAIPQLVEVSCEQAVVALPGGPYSVSAPAGAEVTVPRTQGFAQQPPRIQISGHDVRVLAAATPLRLTGESTDS